MILFQPPPHANDFKKIREFLEENSDKIDDHMEYLDHPLAALGFQFTSLNKESIKTEFDFFSNYVKKPNQNEKSMMESLSILVVKKEEKEFLVLDEDKVRTLGYGAIDTGSLEAFNDHILHLTTAQGVVTNDEIDAFITAQSSSEKLVGQKRLHSRSLGQQPGGQETRCYPGTNQPLIPITKFFLVESEKKRA